jgi:DNA-binding MarR family transcriptional regulator
VGDDFADEFPDGDAISTEVYATLVRTGSALTGEIDRIVQAAGLGVNLQSSNTLAVIEGAGEPLTPSEISARTLISSATMTSTLDRLERHGLVRRLPNPEDRRSVLIEVTDAGRALCDRLLPGINALQIAVMSDLEEIERHQLLDLLGKVLAGAARVAREDPIPLEGRRLRRRQA